MLTNISWTDYITVVAILVVIYYLFVGLRYFYPDLKELLSGKRKLNFKPAAIGLKAAGNSQETEEVFQSKINGLESPSDDESAEVDHLIERLKTVIADACKKKSEPQEFREYLRLIFREYPNVKNSQLRFSINELVVSECERYGAVTLGQDEVDVLWKDGTR